MSSWARDAIFYHLFPLGCLGAPERNPLDGPVTDRLSTLTGWVDHIADLGANAVLLGPVFESSRHGYDVADYFRVDRRLGDDAALAAVCREFHRRGIRVVFDAVFNHTGREFWAFRDIRVKGNTSRYRDWYHLDFTRRSPEGDPFHYQGWAGHYDLAKLDVRNPEVREHLFAALDSWVNRFEIDGLRLDAADALEEDFRRRLVGHCRELRADFWLMGEVVHGDYRQWAHPGGLDATTNYEAYKGLWSSHNDRNYFEIAYTLNRQFGPEGIYRGLPLYSFADNHDVARIASILKERAHLYPLYVLLLTMPGTPSIYYGSELGMEGRKREGTDAPLRPALDPAAIVRCAPHSALHQTIKLLTGLRRRHLALRRGDHRQIHVAHEQLAFLRRDSSETVVVGVNASDRSIDVTLRLPESQSGLLIDELNGSESFGIADGKCELRVGPRWGRVLVLR
jgi:glycosidase